VSLSGTCLSIVSLEKRYKYRFIVSQILIQDNVLKMCLDTRYFIHFYCPRGGGGLYYIRPSFCVITITYEPLHLVR